MRVRIVSYEDVNAWILGKFARKLQEELLKLGVEVDISNKPDYAADINHHIIYMGYDHAQPAAVDTLMITHIDDVRKLSMLSNQMKVAKAGICMSRSTMNNLVSAGLPGERMLYINPAHDSVMSPAKIRIGLTSKVQPDGCKRESLVEELFNHISPDIFSLSIMGAGWDNILNRIGQKGFTVEYYDQFDYEKYVQLVPTFDYYIYTGQDEGSMGFIDALAAGVKTIVTPQGFHLDAPAGITHAFNEQHELVGIFKEIEKERLALIGSVSDWTWDKYALKHLELWQYLLNPSNLPGTIGYNDGIKSLTEKKQTVQSNDLKTFKKALMKGTFRRLYYKAKKIRDVRFVINKVKKLFKN